MHVKWWHLQSWFLLLKILCALVTADHNSDVLVPQHYGAVLSLKNNYAACHSGDLHKAFK